MPLVMVAGGVIQVVFQKENVMNSLSKVLFYAVASVIAGFSLTIIAPPVHAQGGAYCASNDNRFARCQVPWRDAVLVQQASKVACVRGQTWGFDRNGIWVSGGCRGQFAPARGGWGGGGGGRQQQIRCESGGNNYQLCPVNIQRGDDVRIVNQRSSASCQQGRSWGVQPNGIWVNRGCRADFVVNRRY